MHRGTRIDRCGGKASAIGQWVQVPSGLEQHRADERVRNDVLTELGRLDVAHRLAAPTPLLGALSQRRLEFARASDLQHAVLHRLALDLMLADQREH